MTPKKIPLLGRRFMHCADGIAAVEFAIVLPVLITSVFGEFTGRKFTLSYPSPITLMCEESIP